MSNPLVVRPLEMSDLQQIKGWGKHENPLFYSYNFPYATDREYYLWYRSKKMPFKRYIFGAFLEDRLIGYITLKQIRWLKGEAYMGISFDPNYVGQGHGTEAIYQYLEWVFQKFKRLHTIKLKTAIFNERAQKSYEKAGFMIYDQVCEPFEDQSQSFSLLLNYPYFKMVGDEIWTEYIYMMVARPKEKD